MDKVVGFCVAVSSTTDNWSNDFDALLPLIRSIIGYLIGILDECTNGVFGVVFNELFDVFRLSDGRDFALVVIFLGDDEIIAWDSDIHLWRWF